MKWRNNKYKMLADGNALLEMVWISPGTFMMGSPTLEEGRKADEGPQNK